MPRCRAGALATRAILALATVVPLARAQDEPKDTTAAQVAAIQDEYKAAMQAFSEKYSAAKTDEERSQLVESSYPKPEAYASRMLAVAKADPHDPDAFTALSWVVRTSNGQADPSVKEALAILAERHAEDPRIAEIVPALGYSSTGDTSLLDRVLRDNADQRARGLACLALADVAKQRAELAGRLGEDAELRARYEEFAGKAETEALAKADPDALQARAVALYERVRDEFADVPGRRGPLGEQARRVLFEIANLAVGKPAPEIEGEDVDGASLRLGDHRGKVVLLSFWGTWCGPCMAAVPHERSLVERYQEKPFVILGVNSDAEREDLKARMQEEKITWRSWFDGGGTSGPIATAWNVSGWPTVYVIDADGVIRFKSVGFDEKGVDGAIERSLAQIEAKQAKP